MHRGKHGDWPASPEIEKLINDTMNHVDTAADLGCGVGRFCDALLRHANKVYCIDRDSQSIEVAKSRINGNAIFLIEDAEHTSIKNGEVDFLLMVNSFHDMENKDGVAKEIRRVLKNGGLALIIEFKPGLTGFGPPPWLRMRPEEVREIFSRNGMTNVWIKGIDSHNALLFRK